MGQRLWEQSERDLEVARLTLQPRGHYAAANFAHQATEKALKAAHWHLRGEEPPWNHRLPEIAERVAECTGPLPTAVDDALDRLEPLFEQTRYPSGDITEPIPAELVGEPEAAAAIQNAEKVIEWVRKLLQRPPRKAQSETR